MGPAFHREICPVRICARLLRVPQTAAAVHVDRLREDDFVLIAVSGGASGPAGGRRRSRRRGDVGDRGESRVVRQGRVHFHFVADRHGRIHSAPERVRPVVMSRVVLGRWMLQLGRKTQK